MPSNSPARIEIPSKPLGYDASQIVHGCVHTAPRIDASLVRHERAGQATCSNFDSFFPVYVFPRDYRRMPGRTGQFGSGTRDAVIGVESAEFSHGARTCSRLRESARVRFTSEFTIFGVNGARECSGHRTRWNVACPGSSYVDLRLCRV